MSKILVPPVWFLLGGLGMLALHRGFPAALVVPPPWTGWGSLPVAMGLALALSAARLFRRAGDAVEPWETPSALVAAGPYRFTRNPMYLGLALCLFGIRRLAGHVDAVPGHPAVRLGDHRSFHPPRGAAAGKSVRRPLPSLQGSRPQVDLR